jgi:hypothetical protein
MAVPFDKTLVLEPHPDRCERCKLGYHQRSDRKCGECGSTDKYPARHNRRKIIGGKRGRNSGTTGTAKTKR